MSERDFNELTNARRSFEEIASVCDSSPELGAPLLKAASLWLMENYPGQLQSCLLIPKRSTQLRMEIFLRSDLDFTGRRLSYGYRAARLYSPTAYYYVAEEGRVDDDPCYGEGVHCLDNDFLDHFKRIAKKAFSAVPSQ